TPLSPSPQEPVADVWSAAVSTTDGSFIEDWQAEPSLPAVKHSDRTGFDGTIAAVNSATVTSVATGNGGGYIYVIGGNVSTGAVYFSRYSVRLGTVGTNWGIASLASCPSLPGPTPQNPTLPQLVTQSALATSFTVAGAAY